MTYSLGEGCRNGSRGRRAGSVLPCRRAAPAPGGHAGAGRVRPNSPFRVISCVVPIGSRLFGDSRVRLLAGGAGERACVVTVPVSVTLGESSGPLLVSTMCPWARPGDGEFDRLVVGVDREQEPVVAGVAVNAFRCDRRRGPRRACWWPGSSGLPRHLLAVEPVEDQVGGAALGPVQILAGS
jgi:hypothetical protein